MLVSVGEFLDHRGWCSQLWSKLEWSLKLSKDARATVNGLGSLSINGWQQSCDVQSWEQGFVVEK